MLAFRAARTDLYSHDLARNTSQHGLDADDSPQPWSTSGKSPMHLSKADQYRYVGFGSGIFPMARSSSSPAAAEAHGVAAR